jgi:glycine/D-amino acid oxidase-like deaminating enzyme
MSTPHVAVVGGGVMGSTLAYTLAKRGARVTLLERAPEGSGGASAVPAALLNPYRGRSARAADADLMALQATWALVSELEASGYRSGAVRSGVLRVASSPKQARLWAQRPGVRWFGPEAVPEAVVRGGFRTPFGGFVVPEGGWVLPARYLAALRAAAAACGAALRTACDVLAIDAPQRGGPYTLRTSAGSLVADAVALCVGAQGLPPLPAGVASPPELTRVAGEVVTFALETLPTYPLAGAVYGVPVAEGGAAGLMHLGGNHRAADREDPSAPAQLRRAGGWFLPALLEAPQRAVWSGVRAKAEDNRPRVLELAPKLVFAGALAGRGFLAAAALATPLAEALIGGAPDSGLGAF